MNLRQHKPYMQKYEILDGTCKLSYHNDDDNNIYNKICELENLKLSDFVLEYGELNLYQHQTTILIKIIDITNINVALSFNKIAILKLSNNKLALIDNNDLKTHFKSV